MKLFKKRELEENEIGGIDQVWACGGGVQSVAIAALIYTGKLPKPNHSWIVDVGHEKSSTFEYVKEILQPKLLEVGVELHIIKTLDYADNLFFGNKNAMKLPLYLIENGIVKKLSTRCSNSWKTRISNKWLKSKGVKRCDKWLGISIDEKQRVASSRLKWNVNKYPLVDMGITRSDCIDLIARMGWPKPDHSFCYICPNQSDMQWQQTKENYPDDFRKAVEAEKEIRGVNPNMFLHRSCNPLDEINFDNYKFNGFYVGKKYYGNKLQGVGGIKS